MEVTPESIAAFCQTAEFQFMLAALNFEAQNTRLTLENTPFQNIGAVANAQGKLQAISRMLQDDFPGLLIQTCHDQIKVDGGRLLMFSLRVSQYHQRMREG